MENKKYEDYHVLDENEEEIIDAEIVEEIASNEITKHEMLSLNKIERENQIQLKETNAVTSDRNVRKYESVLTEDIEEKVDIKQNEQAFENKSYKDTSFSKYVEAEKKKERSFLAKWSLRLVKLILFIMLLPVIGIVGGGGIGVVGGVSLGILACIGGGLFIIALACFMATQVNAMIVALGISVGITAISFGGIALIIFVMIIKGIISLVRRNKSNREVR